MKKPFQAIIYFLSVVFMKNESLFKQIVLKVVMPVLVALIALAIININLSKQIFNDFSKEKNAIVSGEIKNILEFQDFALELVEEGLDARLRTLSDRAVARLQKAEFNKVDLTRLAAEIGVDTTVEDIYIIKDGIVVNTTYLPDMGLDFNSFGKEHVTYLNRILAEGQFVSERFSIENATGKLKKYCYTPINGEYVLEIGATSADADRVQKTFIDKVNELSSVNSYVVTVDLYIGESNPISFTGKPLPDSVDLRMILKTFADKKTNTRMVENPDGLFQHEFIYMSRNNSELYKDAVIKAVYNRSSEKAYLDHEFWMFVLIFGATILLLVLLMLHQTRLIVRPIYKLLVHIDSVSKGNFKERAAVSGAGEIAKLSDHFNKMIDKLEEYYDDLENRVRQRTLEIRKAHKEITDSITYAGYIQNAIFANSPSPKEGFTDAFVLFKPKDIVSGDLYRFERKDGKLVRIVADCTGHGVPGAMMTLLGITAIDHVLAGTCPSSAAYILDKVDHEVTYMLAGKSNEVKVNDGMDMSVLIVDEATGQMCYAGANHPMYLVRNGELLEYKGSKYPIGAYLDGRQKMFEEISLQLLPGDMLYLFSDGFRDQSGGTEGKKYMKKRFKEFLFSISQYNCEEQKTRLEDEFVKWMGNMPQTDDVLVVGLKYGAPGVT